MNLTVRQAKKILSDNNVNWNNAFDLRSYESDTRDIIRKAAIRVVKFLYTGNSGMLEV